MSDCVEPGGWYPTIEDEQRWVEVRKVNDTGRVLYVCDCCARRKWFDTRAQADRHEAYSFDQMSPAEMGVFPGFGEEIGDYLPGHRAGRAARFGGEG